MNSISRQMSMANAVVGYFFNSAMVAGLLSEGWFRSLSPRFCAHYFRLEKQITTGLSAFNRFFRIMMSEGA